MSASQRSFVTMSVLVVLLLAGLVGGWAALTKPFPERAGASCVDTDVPAGSLLTPGEVSVRVLNASNQSGLASRTMEALTARGFASAGTGNLDTPDIKGIKIWSDDPDHPAVLLVKSQFKKAKVVPGESVDEPGLVIVLGNKPSKLSRAGLNEIMVDTDVVVCGPASS